LALSASGVIPLLAGQWFPALVLLVSPLVVLAGRGSWPVLRSAGRYGDFSYGIYLWACPVQQVLVLWLGKQTPFMMLTALSLVCTFVLAWLSWHFVESRALRLKPRRFSGLDPHSSRVPVT
jgi:peptidoglycan/LPS O-acetylase OafA/YrhL